MSVRSTRIPRIPMDDIKWCGRCQTFRPMSTFFLLKKGVPSDWCHLHGDATGKTRMPAQLVVLDSEVPEIVSPSPSIPDYPYASIPEDAVVTNHYICVKYRCKQSYTACLARQHIQNTSHRFSNGLCLNDPYCTTGMCRQGSEIAVRFVDGYTSPNRDRQPDGGSEDSHDYDT